MSKADQAVACLTQLDQIDEKDYTTLVKNDVGPELLQVFEGYCHHLAPQADEGTFNTLVHLMMTGYLIKANEGSPLAGAKKIIQP